MRSDSENNECVAVIGSMTKAMHAQSVLARAAIRTDLIKADFANGGRGCAYALSYHCEQAENLQRILQNAGIGVRLLHKKRR